MLHRAAHAWAVATAKGRRVGRPSVVNPNQLDYAGRLSDEGEAIAQILTKTGITRTTPYRHLPPRPPGSLTAGAEVETESRTAAGKTSRGPLCGPRPLSPT